MSNRVWKLIDGYIPDREMVLIIGVVEYGNGRRYETDPYTSWRNADGSWPRWPHPFPPTHYTKIPGRDEWNELEATKVDW